MNDRDRHMPATPEGRRLAILELRRQGLLARDIAQALRVGLPEVLEVLRDAEREAGR